MPSRKYALTLATLLLGCAEPPTGLEMPNPLPPTNAGFALCFFGNGVDDVDRVKIRLDDRDRFNQDRESGISFAGGVVAFGTGGSTVALYHFDEGSGDVISDVSGAPGGPSNGVRNFGGAPAGPEWVRSDAPLSN